MLSMNKDSFSRRLHVITGPSGVGKGTLVEKLIGRNEDIWLSISATTRAPRNGETDGKEYFFLDRNSFQDLISSNGLLEWAEFAGNFYGTPIKPIKDQLAKGRKTLLEIELEGSRQVRSIFPEAQLIFIAPPSFDELERRIRGRATDSDDAIKLRLKRAKYELTFQKEFDHVIVNDNINSALLEIEKIVG